MSISTKLERIAQMARTMPGAALWSLSHPIDIEWLKEAYRRTRKDAAVGVDGQTAQEYEQDLEGNLRDLLDRLKAGTYRAPPVRRVYIPKGQGDELRPLGIPTLEDKVAQRAVVMALEAVYEQDFLPRSYGFRPGRSAHQALEAIWKQTMATKGGWVLEVDIQRYFDALDHERLREILRQRVRDGVLLRLIGKWLHAGVLEDGSVSYPTTGTPQGGVISPLLANVYLHEVLDTWVEREVWPSLRGTVALVRYADDFVLLFTQEEDAHQVQAQMAERFAAYGLTLHPTKTRLVDFRKPGTSGDPHPGTFDFLGFTHYWGRSRKGNWVVKRKTSKGRFARSLKKATDWIRTHRHEPLGEQQRMLAKKLKGYYGYYGITGNSLWLARFREKVVRCWKKWLGRRSQKARKSWNHFLGIQRRYPLPPPVVVHSIYRHAARP